MKKERYSILLTSYCTGTNVLNKIIIFNLLRNSNFHEMHSKIRNSKFPVPRRKFFSSTLFLAQIIVRRRAFSTGLSTILEGRCVLSSSKKFCRVLVTSSNDTLITDLFSTAMQQIRQCSNLDFAMRQVLSSPSVVNLKLP